MDMRQLTQALAEAQEGTGEVRAVLLHAAFKPRLPGAFIWRRRGASSFFCGWCRLNGR